MPLLLDAYNILHVTGVLPPDLAGLDLDGLADLVAESRFCRERVWLVCDGMRPNRPTVRREGIALSWTGAGHTADDWIIGLIQRTSSPRSMTVVTSDRAIERAVRRRGAATMRSDAFLSALVEDHAARRRRKRAPARPEAIPQREVARWLSYFGLDDSILSLEAQDAPKGSRATPAEARSPRPSPRAATGLHGRETVDELLADIDMGTLLDGTPPRRTGPRAPRRSRRDRRQ